MTKTFPHYKVTGDPETGQWLDTAEYIGEVIADEWFKRIDSDDVMYTTYNEDDKDADRDGGQGEVRAIEVHWVRDDA